VAGNLRLDGFGGYTDVSFRYKDYYRQVLASLQREIAASESGPENFQPAQAHSATASQESMQHNSPFLVLQQESPGSPNWVPVHASVSSLPTPRAQATPELVPQVDNCTKAEAAKIKRFLGISRDAGIADAIGWADSDNPGDRAFVAEVLADIGTPEALEHLKTLCNDPNPGVKATAKISLEHLGSASYTVQRQTISWEDLKASR
jgi:hypothetical protein